MDAGMGSVVWRSVGNAQESKRLLGLSSAKQLKTWRARHPVCIQCKVTKVT